MELEEIKSLAQLMSQNGLTVLQFKQGEMELRLERKQPRPSANTQPFPGRRPESVAPETAPSETAAADALVPGEVEITAPLVGVFYTAPEPGANPFVIEGARVKKGDVVCILEAMKLMNEVTAPCDGTITRICCANGQLAEYGQVLFRVKEG